MAKKYTETEWDYIRETSETIQKFVLGAGEILDDMDYDSAFKFILGVTQTAQDHIATTLNEVAQGKGTEEDIRLLVTHLAPAVLLNIQLLYSAIDRKVLVDRSKFIDEVTRRSAETVNLALNQLGGKRNAH